MSKFLFRYPFAIIFVLSFSSTILTAEYKYFADIEYGLMWQGKNQFQIPNNNQGTRVDLKKEIEDTKSFLVNRFYLSYTTNKTHQIKLLFAPLEIKGAGRVEKNILFQNYLFTKNELLLFTYKFNSYRLSYAYHIRQNDSFIWHIGATAKIRDAKISIKGQNRTETKTDLGFVPLLNFGFNYTPSFLQNIELEFDADALAAPQGRAEDLSLKLLYKAKDEAAFYFGYRLLEGGADNEKVYTFSLFHYFIAGMRFSF